MRIVKQLPSIANVGAGNTVTLNCPVGLTYEKITFVLGGTIFTRAQLKNISVKVNGKELQAYQSGTELDYINDYYGRADTANYLTLWFNRPELRELGSMRLTGLGTKDVQSLTVEADIDAGASAPTLSAYAMLREPEPLGLVTKVKAFPATFATSGKQDIDNIPRGPRIAAIHLFKADISAVEVEVDAVKVWDASKTEGEVFQKEALPVARVPQTAVATHIDFLLDGDIAQALVTDGVADFRLRPTLDTSGSVRTVVEYLDQFAGL